MTDVTEERLARWEGEQGLWKAVADLIGECWPDWPSHGNAPLAIAAHIALIHEEKRRLRAELAAVKELADKREAVGEDIERSRVGANLIAHLSAELAAVTTKYQLACVERDRATEHHAGVTAERDRLREWATNDFKECDNCIRCFHCGGLGELCDYHEGFDWDGCDCEPESAP